MGRFYLPPHVVVFVALLAALGAVLTLLARPASGHAPPDVAPAPAAVPQPVVASEPVERAPLRAPDPSAVAPVPTADPGAVVLRPAGGSTIVIRSRPRGPVVARLDGRT